MELLQLKSNAFGVFVSLLLPLLLIPGAEASEKYLRDYPPFFYRCDNGQTLVSRLDYEDQFGDGEVLSVYPYPVEERSRVLWRSAERQYISIADQQYDCKQWRRSDGDFFGIPDPAALRRYAKRFNSVVPSRFICEGGHSVVFRITDFVDAGHHHGLMEVGDEEQIGLYFTRGTSGHFNSKSISTPGLSFAWAVHSDDDQMSVMRWFLSIDDKSFSCKPLS